MNNHRVPLHPHPRLAYFLSCSSAIHPRQSLFWKGRAFKVDRVKEATLLISIDFGIADRPFPSIFVMLPDFVELNDE
jgi:hypothetical protein